MALKPERYAALYAICGRESLYARGRGTELCMPFALRAIEALHHRNFASKRYLTARDTSVNKLYQPKACECDPHNVYRDRPEWKQTCEKSCNQLIETFRGAELTFQKFAFERAQAAFDDGIRVKRVELLSLGCTMDRTNYPEWGKRVDADTEEIRTAVAPDTYPQVFEFCRKISYHPNGKKKCLDHLLGAMHHAQHVNYPRMAMKPTKHGVAPAWNSKTTHKAGTLYRPTDCATICDPFGANEATVAFSAHRSTGTCTRECARVLGALTRAAANFQSFSARNVERDLQRSLERKRVADIDDANWRARNAASV